MKLYSKKNCKHKKFILRYTKRQKPRKIRKIRKTRKIQFGGNIKLLEIIKPFFPEDKFSIETTPSMVSFNVYNKEKSDYKNMCVSFSIEYDDISTPNLSLSEYKSKHKKINIHLLSKCIIPGSITLEKMELFAKEIGATQIDLEDSSHIKACDTRIPLSILDILSTGESWYNAKGFKSQNHEREKENNSQILTRKAIEFIDECAKIRHTPDVSVILETFNASVPASMSVQEYFTDMKKKLKIATGEECAIFVFASKLLTMIKDSNLIMYDPSKLTKIIL
jgi:hypothetical protein